MLTLVSLYKVFCFAVFGSALVFHISFKKPLCKIFIIEDHKIKVFSSFFVSLSLDKHPFPPECSVQQPVPPLHCGHPVHRREPGALQPQTHPEPSPETTALLGSVYKECTHSQTLKSVVVMI